VKDVGGSIVSVRSSHINKALSTDERRRQAGGSELNDDLIIDCCQYFTRHPQHYVALCSGDKNLCVKAESIGGQSSMSIRGYKGFIYT